MITLSHYMILSAILFTMSLIGIVMNRRHLIVMLLCIELMLLAVNTNLVAISQFLHQTTGEIFVFFILTVAAAESAIGNYPILAAKFLKDCIKVFSHKKKISKKNLYLLN